MTSVSTNSHQQQSILVTGGTGRGRSVIETINAFRPGVDVPCDYSEPSAAEAELGWQAERDLVTMCRSGSRWQFTWDKEPPQ